MRTFLLLFGVFVFNNASAQRVCAIYNPDNFRPESSQQSSTASAGARDTSLNEVISIPVVVHVVYNNNIQNISDEQVVSQITSLNNDFRLLNANASGIPAAFKSNAADVRIQFVLAKYDPMGRPTNGIVRRNTNKTSFRTDDAVKFTAAGGSDAWDTYHYLNIWVCSQEGNSLGYSSIPGSQPDRDGVVINYNVFGTTGVLKAPFNKGRTATHEIGHWMGLKHIWGDANCGSDDVDDTPRQKSFNYGMPSFPHLSDCSINGYGDMFMNYMDLTDD
ncbi:MAG: M43 family zinc metalloprotease, partial [Ferruginibacter sp.]